MSYGNNNENFSNLSIDDKQQSFQADRSGEQEEGWSKTKIAGVTGGALAAAAAIGGGAYAYKKHHDKEEEEEKKNNGDQQQNAQENKEGEASPSWLLVWVRGGRRWHRWA